jgi:hypothetical protein
VIIKIVQVIYEPSPQISTIEVGQFSAFASKENIHGENCLSLQMEPGSLEYGALGRVIGLKSGFVVIPKITSSSASNALKCLPL